MASIQVREVFKISKVGKIAGCMVTSGTVRRGDKARLVRDDVEVAETRVDSLKRHKEDVTQVKAGMECGIGLEKVNDIRENDRIETYKEVEVARTLSSTSS
jgi:translation initiation factor IF-2